MSTIIARFRPVNLVIIALTQLFFYYFILKPLFFQKSQINLSIIEDWHFFIITVITCLVAIGGYIVNDIFDINIDLKNKPQKTLNNISLWKFMYGFVGVLGLILTSGLAYIYENIYFVLIYNTSVYSLFEYSYRLKCKPLIGNVIVALFSALVVAAVLGPFWLLIPQLSEIEFDLLVMYFSYYFIFAFLVSLIREILKDMEDFYGDKSEKCKTLAVESGIARTKIYVLFFGLVFIASLLSWLFRYYQMLKIGELIMILVAVIIPFLAIFYFILKAKESWNLGLDLNPYSSISCYLKLLMLSGISTLVISVIF